MPFLSAFIDDNDHVTVHSSGCGYVVREWRKYGESVVTNAESEMGTIRQLRKLGIRVASYRVMPCSGIPEGFWSLTPSGDPLKLLSTRKGASVATARVKRQTMQELETMVNDMSPYLREMLGLTRES